MADTVWAGSEAEKLYLTSGQFTSTIKTSEAVGAVDNNVRGISWDGMDTPWTGLQSDKFYLTSGQFTSTIKTSEAVGAVDGTPHSISWDGSDTPMGGFSTKKLYLTSGQFTSTVKTSEDISGIDINLFGITYDGANTPWCGSGDVKLYLTSGQFTSTLKTSEDVSGVDGIPTAISWDGTNTPWTGTTNNKLYLTSGQFTSTIKTSEDIGGVDTSPTGIEHGDADARLGIFPAVGGGVPVRFARPQYPHRSQISGRTIRSKFHHYFTPSSPLIIHPINPTVERTSTGTWLFSWTPDTSPYSVWLNGIELASGLTDEEYEYEGGEYPDEAPPLEIVNDGDTAENYSYPPIYILQWRGIQSAAAYIVEEYINGSWIQVVNIMERGKGYYSWQSDALADATPHQFRITALDQYGNAGTPLAFTETIARNPDTPDVSIDIVAGEVVVSAV